MRHILERGFRDCVWCTKKKKYGSLFGDRVDVSVGDLASPDSVRLAIQGTNIVFLVNVGPENPQRDKVAATICKEFEIHRIVKLSSLDVEQGLAIGAWHEKGEAAIREVGIPFVFVRPTSFMKASVAPNALLKQPGARQRPDRLAWQHKHPFKVV